MAGEFTSKSFLRYYILTGFEALDFITQLSEGQKFPQEVVEAFKALLLRSHLQHIDSQDLHCLVGSLCI